MTRLLMLLVLSAAAGCSAWRWSSRAPDGGAQGRVLRDPAASEGLHPPPVPGAPESGVPAVPEKRSAPPRPVVPETEPEKAARAVFYSDLGPSELDVSGYPAQQRHDYGVYRSLCSRCHGLERSLNAPHVSRLWWSFYVQRMRLRARRTEAPFTPREIEAVLDFLEYDGRRKRTPRFEEMSRELRRRFDRVIEERMRRLQESPRRPPE